MVRFPLRAASSTSENNTWPCSDVACRCRSWNVSWGAATGAERIAGRYGSYKKGKRELKRRKNRKGSIGLRSVRSLSCRSLPQTRLQSRYPICLCEFFSLVSRVLCGSHRVFFFGLQRRIRNEASNAQRFRQLSTTTTNGISLWGFADNRDADRNVSLWSTSATAAAGGGRVSVRQYAGPAATGRRVAIWGHSAACTVNWWGVWEHNNPTTATTGWISVRRHRKPTSSGISVWEQHNPVKSDWRALWHTAAHSATAEWVAFWWYTTTNSATRNLHLWEHSATRHRTDDIDFRDGATTTCRWYFAV